MADADTQVLDIVAAIDDGPITRLLIQVGALCAMVSFLDGIDSSSIGIAVPLIADKLHLSHAQSGPVFSAGLFGGMLGALSFGPLADRVGRQRMLVVATLVIGAFTVLTAAAWSFDSLLTVRFLAGIGLGGATPCLVALASEYAPKAHRAAVTALVIAAFSVGILAGALLSAYLLSRFGWQSIFLVGGVLPLAASACLAAWLPESIRFLLIRRPNTPKIGRIVARIVPHADLRLAVVAKETRISGAPVANLFSEGRAGGTLLLWMSFAAVFGTSVAIFLWTPTLMRDHGIPLPRTAMVLGLSSLGAIVGSAAVGRLMEKFGSARTLAVAFAAGALVTASLAFAANSLALFAGDMVLAGMLVNGIGTTGVLAFAALRYPTAMRSTGVGWAMAVARLGQVITPLLTSLLLSRGWRLDTVFLVFGGLLLVGAVSILLFGRLGPQPGRTRSPAGLPSAEA